MTEHRRLTFTYGRKRALVAALLIVATGLAAAELPTPAAAAVAPVPKFPAPMPQADSASAHLPPPDADAGVDADGAQPNAPANASAGTEDAAPRPGNLQEPPAGPAQPNPPASPQGAGVQPGQEVVAQRTATMKTFATDTPGKFKATVYSGPVHYKDSAGQWRDIDNTLVDGAPGRLKNRGGLVGLDIAKNAKSRSLATVSADATHSVSFSLQGAASSAVSRPGAMDASYRDILPDVDLELFGRNGGLKEDIVLKTADATNRFVFPIELDGLTASLDEDTNVLSYKDADGVVRLETPAPYMEDSKLDLRSGDGAISRDVDYELVGSGSDLTLVLTASRAWLDDPARVYPVRIDPSIYWKSTTLSDDTYVQTQLTWNNSSDSELKVGTYDWGTHKTAAFMNFDVRGLNGKNIDSATFYVLENWAYSCQPRGLGVYRVLEPWGESQNRILWNFPGANFEMGTTNQRIEWGAFAMGYEPGGCSDGWAYWPTEAIRQLVHNWTHGIWSQYGLAMYVDPGSENDSYAWKTFWSWNACGGGDCIPHIDIMYSDPNRAPNTPDFVSPGNEAILQTTTPTLSARGTDPDGNNVAMRFRVWRASDGAYMGGKDGGWICNGCSDSFVPSLPNDRYYWETWAWDGQYDSPHVGRYFRLDTVKPSTPTGVSSTTHTVGVASSNPTLSMRWDPSSDPAPASGVQGYSTLLTTSSAAEAPTNVTPVPGTTANPTAQNGDGTYWFNVRARDVAGNWGDNARQGPYYIDRAAPTMSKVADKSAVTRGDTITYTVTVTNTKPWTVSGITVSDVLPSGLAPVPSSPTFDSPTGSSCTATTTPSCVFNGQTLSISAFSLLTGTSRSFSYKALAVGGDRGCSVVNNAAVATNSAGPTSAAVSVTVCESALGLERWWSYFSRDLGPQTMARLNPANGNLVLQENDTTPIQAHGRLSYVLRRTYNSQDTGGVELPSSIGRGWTLNVSEAGDLGEALVPSSLSVPFAEVIANPAAFFLIDRDGTRHAFRPRALTTAIDVTAITASSTLATLTPKSFAAPAGSRVCVAQTYTPPAGVDLAVWRYVRVNDSASLCGGNLADSTRSPAVLGYVAISPDRVRYEFSWNGRLLSMTDAAGVELRYVYDSVAIGTPVGPAPQPLGGLQAIYEPRSCTDLATVTMATATCRRFWFRDVSSTERHVTDPAGRTVRFFYDDATNRRLVRAETWVGTTKVAQNTYTYGGCTGSTANQMCSTTDARGNATDFTYSTSTLGARRLATMLERARQTKAGSARATTTFTYNDASSYVTADTGTQRRRYLGIDASGRVGEIDDGNTSDQYVHQTLYTWDTPAATCRQPDAVVDNNLCRTVRRALNSGVTPDEDTSFLYNSEGAVLRERRVNAGTNLDTTYGYRAQYVHTDGAVLTFDDTVAGLGAVTSAGPTTGRNDTSGKTTLFAISDRTQSLTPRGNGASPAGGFAAYRSIFLVDNNTTKAPSTVPSGTLCTDPASPAGNTGLLCESQAPAFDGVNATRTRYTYDTFGQRLSMTTPKAIAENATPPAGDTRCSSAGAPLRCYTYTYFADTDRELSGNVSAGGWLRAVTDPTGNFAAFGYDRAGNVARSWDRNATRGDTIGQYPGSVGSPPSMDYRETLYAAANAYAEPWRYLRSERQPNGSTTTYTMDDNGNVTRMRPPRGVAAGNANYDVVQSFDANDNLISKLLPEESAAGAATTSTYDQFDNRDSTTDPNGRVTTFTYDDANRLRTTSWTRGAPPANPADRPAACPVTTAADAPLPLNRVKCTTTLTYDGVDNITAASDGNGQVTTSTFDAVHRQTVQLVPRNAGGLTTVRTERAYDLDGNLARVCQPRQFTESTGCTASSRFATHYGYDRMGRRTSVTTYRDATSAAQVASFAYDADGNATLATDANVHSTTSTYDLLDRQLTETKPRSATMSTTTSFGYDPAGNRTSVVRPAGVDGGTGADGDVVIDGATYPAGSPYVLADGKNYNNLTLTNGGWIAAPASGTLTIKVKGTLSVCATCGITVSGRGAAGGAGGTSKTAPAPGGSGSGGGGGGDGGTSNGGGGGGAGYATAGTAGSSLGGNKNGAGGAGGAAYGNADLSHTAGNPAAGLGSGGGGGGRGTNTNGAAGGSGGGYLRIAADTLDVQGALRADGAAGGSAVSPGAGGGGGSGGSIWLTAVTANLALPGGVTATGGAGGTGAAAGGAGASGRIRIDAETLTGAGVPAGHDRHSVGRVELYSYDVNNRVVDTVSGASASDIASTGPSSDGLTDIRTRRAYDVDGRVAAVYDPRAFRADVGNPDHRFVTRADFDRDGRRTAVYLPRYDNAAASDLGLGTTQTSQCPTAVTPQAIPGVTGYPAGTGVCVTRMSYDAAGNRTQVRLATSNGTDNRYVTFSFTDDNLVEKVTTPGLTGSGSGTRVDAASYVYDGARRRVKTTDAESEVQVTEYTSDGLVSRVTGQPNGTLTHVTNFGYDANGNKTTESIDDANQSPVTLTNTTGYTFDNLVRDVTDPGGNVTSYGYDPAGNTTTVKSPRAHAGLEPAVTNAYTSDNLLLATVQPIKSDGSRKRWTTYTYDRGGRKTAQVVAEVDAANNILASDAAQGFVYSASDRLVRETGRNGESVTFGYDAAGNRTSVDDSTSGSEIDATYYLDGLVRSVDSGSRTAKYTYDGTGARAARADETDGTATRYLTSYVYGDGSEPVSMTSDLTSGTTSWTYWPDGNPKRETDGTGQTVDFTFAPDDTLTSQVLRTSGGTPMATWGYGYDSLYRRKTQSFTGTSASPGSAYQGSASYNYDRAGRLDNFTLPGKPLTDLTWDGDGNRLTIGSTTFTYNADDSINTSQKSGEGARQHAYRPFGGLDNDTCAAYTYDGFDRLKQVRAAAGGVCPGTPTTDYASDGLDRQRSRTEGGATSSFFFDGLDDALTVQQEAGVDTAYAIDAFGFPQAAKRFSATPVVDYLTSDGSGNVATATSAAGTVMCTARFDPYGTPLDGSGGELAGANACSSGSTVADVFYRGARRDESTGNYQFGSRTYSPGKGDFLMPDSYRNGPAGQQLSVGTDPLTMNRYSYVNGDPINFVDPDGHKRCGLDPRSWGDCAGKAGSKIKKTTKKAVQITSDIGYGLSTVPSFWNNVLREEGAKRVDQYINATGEIPKGLDLFNVAVNPGYRTLDKCIGGATGRNGVSCAGAVVDLVGTALTLEQAGASTLKLIGAARTATTATAEATTVAVEQSAPAVRGLSTSDEALGALKSGVNSGAEGAAGAGRTIALDTDAIVKFNEDTVQSALRQFVGEGDRLVATPNVVAELQGSVGIKNVDDFLALRGIESVAAKPGASVPATALHQELGLEASAVGNAGDALNIAEAGSIGANLFITADRQTIGATFGHAGEIFLPRTGGVRLPFIVV